MRIRFCFAWLKPGASLRQAFKTAAASELFEEYLKRMSRFADVEVSGGLPSIPAKGSRCMTWICSTSEKARKLTSEGIAESLEKVKDTGCRELQVAVGGPDGFKPKDLSGLNIDLNWNFGPLTLPHELAAIVAGEQLYRAFTILNGHPYHKGH